MERAPVRLRDTPSALLLIVLMLVSSQRLYSTNWTTGLGTVLLLALFGSVLGLILGRSRFNGGVVFILVVAYSLSVLPLATGWVLVPAIPWSERMIVLGGKLSIALEQLFTAQAVEDSTLFVVAMGVLYWFISLTGGYKLVRGGNFGAAVVPAGIALIIIQLFDMEVGDRVYVLAIYAFLCLLLLGRLAYHRNRQMWKEKNVWVSAEAITDLNIVMAAAALILVLVVWALPVSGRPLATARAVWENVTRPVRERQEELRRTIQSLQGDQIQGEVLFGDTLGLGREAASGNDVFLRIRAPLFGGSDRYYWRVRTYDLYDNDQWFTEFASQESFSPTQVSLSLADPLGISGEFVFTAPNQNLSSLVTPSRPIWISRPADLSYIPAASGRIDPLMFTASPIIRAGTEYLVHSNLYDPTVFDLRQAGVNYPTWVTDHYLQLPADLPPEIGSLALEITAGLETPYDKATAVTTYLRENIAYKTTIEAAPAGRDMLSWFLFDVKSGFCNYYASAEVVMLRSIGIPARMVVGYAQGEYEPPNQYTVRQRDSHAWPEVYFPGIGWVEFEPTGNQDPLVRPAGQDPSAQITPTPPQDGTPSANEADQTPLPLGEGNGPGAGIGQAGLLRLTIFFISAVVLIIAIVIAYFFGGFDKLIAMLRRTMKKPAPILLKDQMENLGITPPAWVVRWAYQAGLGPAEKSFSVVYRSLRWLGEPVSAAQTPAEAAAVLRGYIPRAGAEIQSLLEECERSLYSQAEGDLARARRSAESIRKLTIGAAVQEQWKKFKAKWIPPSKRK
jgi:transglutaminase-like putative cysteine protease